MPTGPEATFSSNNPPEGSRPQPNATILFGDVGMEDAAGMYTDIANPISFFVDTIINNRLEQDRHVYMMGLASPTGFQGQSAAFVQLAAPTTLRIVDGTVARLNEPPIVPSPQSLDPNWILLDAHAEAPVLTISNDGITPYYRVTFCHVYGRVNPADNVYNDLTFARPPWLNDDFPNGRLMPSTNLDPTLADVPAAPFNFTIPGAGGSFG